MKRIWDSQNEEPLYAMNEAALHRVVQGKNRKWNRCLARCFAAEITVGLFSAALMLVYAGVLALGNQAWLITPWRNSVAPSVWDFAGLLAAGAIWLYYSAYMYRSRKRQQQRAEVFDSSLRGDLDRALSQTDFQIALARQIVWRGLLPVWVAVALWVAVLFHLKGAPAWTYVLTGAVALGALVMVVSERHRSIRDRYLPRRRELESLRAKLSDPER